jgi:hypothetical protein
VGNLAERGASTCIIKEKKRKEKEKGSTLSFVYLGGFFLAEGKFRLLLYIHAPFFGRREDKRHYHHHQS